MAAPLSGWPVSRAAMAGAARIPATVSAPRDTTATLRTLLTPA